MEFLPFFGNIFTCWSCVFPFQTSNVIFTPISENGQRKIESSGSEDKKIPMLKNIYSTKVMSAWKGKCKQREKNIDSDCSQDCRNVIDVLSLIPPELLTNEQANDEEEQDLDNDIPEDVSPDNDSSTMLPDLDPPENGETSNDNANNIDNNAK